MDPHIRSLPPAPASLLLTPEMICKALSISRRTLRSWVTQHVCPEPLRLGPDGRPLRWHPADVLDYLQSTHGREVAQAVMERFAEDAGKPDGPQ